MGATRMVSAAGFLFAIASAASFALSGIFASALMSAGWSAGAAATLRIHANRTVISKREVRLLSRFTGANPHVALVGVPSLPFEVSDLEALRAIADQITGDVVKA